MKITYREIVSCTEAYRDFINKRIERELALQLAPLSQQLQSAFQFFVEQEQGLLKDLGIENTQDVDEELAKTYQEERDKLLDVESEIEIESKIAFEQVASVFSTIAHTDYSLSWLIEFPDREEKTKFAFGEKAEEVTG